MAAIPLNSSTLSNSLPGAGQKRAREDGIDGHTAHTHTSAPAAGASANAAASTAPTSAKPFVEPKVGLADGTVTMEDAVDASSSSSKPAAGRKRAREQFTGVHAQMAGGSSSAVGTTAQDGGSSHADGAGEAAGGDDAEGQSRTRGRRVRTLNLSEPYKPGVGLWVPDMFAMACRIADELQASFVEDADKTAVAKLQRVVLMRKQNYERERAFAQQAGGDEDAARREAAALEQLQSAVAELEELRENVNHRVRQRIQVSMQRVLLMRDVSDVNDRSHLVAANEADVSVDDSGLVCPRCHNRDPNDFNHEYKSGDVICIRCGAIASERNMFEGDWTRSFEGEDNESTLGPSADPLLSSRYNLRTGLAITSGVSFEVMRKMRITNKYVELGSSSMSGEGARSERRTREGYKDEQKLKVFERFDRAAERLALSHGASARAKQIFALFRENREHVMNLSEMVAAAMIAAVEELEYMRRQAEYFAAQGRAPGPAGAAAPAAGAAEVAAVAAPAVPSMAPSASATAPPVPSDVKPVPTTAVRAMPAAAAVESKPPAAAPAASASAASAPTSPPVTQSALPPSLPTNGVMAPAPAGPAAARPAARPLKSKKPISAKASYIDFSAGGQEERKDDADIVFARTHTLDRPVLGSVAAEVAASVSEADVARLTANANDAQDLAPDLDMREEFRAPS